MTDKELIKQEIERLLSIVNHRLENNNYIINETGLDEQESSRIHAIQDTKLTRLGGEYIAYNKIMQFIDSLPEEPASEDLTHAAYHYANNLHMKRQIQLFEEKDVAADFIAGAEWQKQQMMKDAVELHIVESFNPVGTKNKKPHGFTALCYNAEYHDFYPVMGQTIKVIPIKTE